MLRRVRGLRVARPFALDPPMVTKGLRAPSVQLSINAVNRNFKPLLERASLPPIRFRDLCHGFLSLLAQSGQPIRNFQAQEAGG